MAYSDQVEQHFLVKQIGDSSSDQHVGSLNSLFDFGHPGDKGHHKKHPPKHHHASRLILAHRWLATTPRPERSWSGVCRAREPVHDRGAEALALVGDQ